jgi:hypothetical protein
MNRPIAVLAVGAFVLCWGAFCSAASAQAPGAAWSSDIHDFDDAPLPGPAAISLAGARNGAYAGKVVLASGQVLKATVTDLKVEGDAAGPAAIPAAAIRVRYAAPCGSLGAENIRPVGNDHLLESPPAEARTKLPVWVTVRVPKDAKAGSYAGRLTLDIKDAPAVNVPIKIDVRDWTLADPQDWRTWVELVQSPDTLALEYDVPLWSEKHWALIAKSFDLMSETGSRTVCVPLIARTNYGNAESMVRWIKKGDAFEYDFSIMDKYLDLAEKHLGKPRLTQLYAWEVYLKPPRDQWTKVAASDPHGAAGASRLALAGKGPAVTLVDSAGKTETFYTPRYEDPAGQAAWKPLYDALRTRFQKRGLEKTMMLGVVPDEEPSAAEVKALAEISGGLPWTSCSHHLNSIVPFKTLGTLQRVAPFGYAAVALDFYFNFNPAKAGRNYGWNGPLSVQYWRFQYFNAAPRYTYNNYVAVRHAAEMQLAGNKSGLGHIGGDFWPCIKDKKGIRSGTVTDRFPESYWHNLQIMSWLLGPGPDGPVGTTRLEVFREGIQECEARIAIESALMDDARKAKLGDDLAKRAQEYLDARVVDIWKGYGVSEADLQANGMVTEYRKWYFEIAKRQNCQAGLKWYIENAWQQRSARIFDLAGEVERKLQGGK